MGLAQLKPAYINEDEYLSGEEFSAFRHEYLDGKVYTMPESSDKHNLVTGNMAFFLNVELSEESAVIATKPVR